MKKFFITLITLASISLNITAAVGDWKIYMSYSEPQQIQETGNYLFVQASNSLYLYNKNDQSIQTFDKTTGMSDVVVTNISWNQKTKRLIVVYDNSNIDLIDLQGNVTNVPYLYNKSMTEDKTVNSIVNNDKYAYIATNFGGIKLNVASGEVYESYLLGQSIKRFAVSGSTIYALNTQNKAISAPLYANLQDKANWTSVTTYPAGIFDEDKSAYNNNIEQVKTLKPDGPKY
ncbi:MAG: Por secretion system protein, partial [Prevotellaceae bacterium]|nr:Por secretion system protein [Prevotellaceae bacterium]MDY5209926.1 Por secretion system protein [Prevotella sp.]